MSRCWIIDCMVDDLILICVAKVYYPTMLESSYASQASTGDSLDKKGYIDYLTGPVLQSIYNASHHCIL